MPSTTSTSRFVATCLLLCIAGCGDDEGPVDAPLGEVFVAPPTVIPIEGDEPAAALDPPVDLDGDGDLDTAVIFRGVRPGRDGTGGRSGDVLLMLGDGAGGFTPGDRLALSTEAEWQGAATAIASGSRLRSADLDGDGDHDLIATDAGQNPPTGMGSGMGGSGMGGGGRPEVPGYVLVYENVGGAFVRGAPIATPPRATDAIAVDLDADGRLDLFVVNRSLDDQADSSYEVLLGQGTVAGFTELGRVERIACRNARFASAGDLDGDGRLDVVVPCTDDDTLLLLFGDGDGTFAESVLLDGFGLDEPHDTHVGDVDGDGDADVVVANIALASFVPRVSVLLGDGSGGFASAPGSPYEVESPGTQTPYVAVADVAAPGDGRPDGRLDVVVANRSPNQAVGERDVQVIDSVTVLVNETGRADFVEALDLRLPLELGPLVRIQNPVLGDFDGDGLVDLAVAQTGGSEAGQDQPVALVVALHRAVN